MIGLGRVDAMIARLECDFCSLIVLGVKQAWKGEWPEEIETTCCLDAVDISRQLHNGYALQITAWHKGRPFQWIEFEVVAREEGESFPVPRKVDVFPKVDFARMRGLLRTCEETHDGCKLVLKTPDEMRIIDLEEMNIVGAPPECRYFALSYVWGRPSKPWLTLTRENSDSLRAPGSLIGANLPSTILDAIQTCKELGERYLWVDSLCIVQDDAAYQKRQIDIMDTIYASATCTLVAAAGSNANTGFPGVSTWTRATPQQTSTIQDMEVSNTLPQLKHMIEVSAWNTRGWTYQERIFSHKSLVFAESETYYACSQGVWYENPHRLASTVWTSERFKWKPSTGAFMEVYANNVTDYTLRSLTSQADIIRAFQGVLNDMSRQYHQTFHAALPEGKFEEALMWQKSRQSNVKVGAKGAPSWSWAAAETPIKYTIPEERIHLSSKLLPATWPDGEQPLQILITWYLNIEGALVLLKTDIPEAQPPINCLAPPEDLQALTLLEPGRLLFSTQRAYLNLRNSVPYKTQDTWWTDYVNDIDLTQLSILSILLPGAESDNLAGFIEMERSWAESSTSDPKRVWEFLAISLTTSKSDDFMHYHLTQQRNVNSPLVWRRNVRQLVVHVMLIERKEGVACRLGVGKVFLDMWERAASEMSWVVLE
jgi:hypothetical protein